MHRTKTAILATLAILIGLSSGSATADDNSGGTRFTPKPRRTTTEKYSNWMSRLPDTASLSHLSLPGTHDSCALHNGASFGFAQCQTWKLEHQLQAGIRFIDIRCRHVGDKLLIYHGVIDQKMTFEQVRDVCREFLRRHPSECITMSVKEESTPMGNSRSFAESFKEATKGDDNLWHVSRKIPKLSSVRNRIVLIDRVGTLGGLNWRDMQLQDHYDAPVEKKANFIRAHFKKTIRADRGQWFINFCSGTFPGRLVTPKKYALKSNQVALEFLRRKTLTRPVRLGTIVMDFPGEELIERIVESNFAAKKTR